MQLENKVAEQIDEILEEFVSTEGAVAAHIVQIDDTHIQVEEIVYDLVINYRNGFNLDAFKKRYQEYFDKFDFLVGDWGFEQLRLKGFYQLNQKHVARDQLIDYLEDYLREYCNFGCQYFLLAKQGAVEKYNQLLAQKKEQPKQQTQINKVSRKQINTKAPHKNKRKEKDQVSKKAEEFKIKLAEDKLATIPKQRPVSKPIKLQRKKKLNEKGIDKVSKATEAPTNKKGQFVIKQKMK